MLVSLEPVVILLTGLLMDIQYVNMSSQVSVMLIKAVGHVFNARFRRRNDRAALDARRGALWQSAQL